MATGSIQNKDAFLNKIAGKLGRASKEHVQIPEWEFQPQLGVFQKESLDELKELFEVNSRAKSVDVLKTKADNLLEIVKEAVEKHGGGSLVATKDERFEQYGLTEILEREDSYVWDAALGEKNIRIAKRANIGIFFSEMGLAESGTVVQFNDKDIARSVSLLPRTYISIVPKSSIVPRMTQAVQSIHSHTEAGKPLATCINFISGPSNSADIEMNIVIGVHGPVEAVHIIVEDR